MQLQNNVIFFVNFNLWFLCNFALHHIRKYVCIYLSIIKSQDCIILKLIYSLLAYKSILSLPTIRFHSKLRYLYIAYIITVNKYINVLLGCWNIIASYFDQLFASPFTYLSPLTLRNDARLHRYSNALLTAPASCILIIIRRVICQVEWKSADAGSKSRRKSQGASSSRRVPRRDDD